MATKCLVFARNDDGSYEGIMVTQEGQIEGGVGEVLYNAYDTEDKVKELVSLGNALVLSETLAESEFFERDLDGEFENYEATDDEDLEYISDMLNVDFVYTFVDGEWYFAELDDSRCYEWQSLEDMF